MVNWAPIRLPLERRLQTAAVLFFVGLHIFNGMLLFIAIFSPLLPFTLAYIAWYTYWDSAPDTGSRKRDWMRRLRMWKYFCDYFPVQLVKTVSLDPSTNYIFGYHPHGVISVGAWGTMATEGAGFSEIFPGIDMHVLTLGANFRIPFLRELFLSLGLASVAKKACLQLLGKKKSITIVVGGAQESLDAHPGSTTLTLRNRKGFCRLALQTGTPLVPVFGFGENDLWDQADNREGTWTRWFQDRMKRVTGFTLPLFHGRGVFQYSYGLMPYRQPVSTVVGRPVHVDQVSDPTPEQVDDVHRRYVAALQELFDNHQAVYLPTGAKAELIIH